MKDMVGDNSSDQSMTGEQQPTKTSSTPSSHSQTTDQQNTSLPSNADTSSVSRRRVIRSTIGGLGLAAIPGLASTSRATATETVSAEQAGVHKAVEKLLDKGEVDKAAVILDEHNVYYSHARTTSPGPVHTNSEGDITTQAVYSDEQSSCSLIGYQYYNREFVVSNHVYLEAGGAFLDEQGPSDAFGISFSDARWEPEGGTFSCTQEVEINEHPSGVIGQTAGKGTIDQNNNTPFKFQGHMEGRLEKRKDLSNQQHDVFGHYGHTWTPFGIGASVSFGIQFGILSVEVSTGGNSWTIESPVIEI